MGYIKPSIRVAKGIGTKNLFSRWDLYMIYFFERLIRKRGLSREHAGILIKIINSNIIAFCKEHGNEIAKSINGIVIKRRSVGIRTVEVEILISTEKRIKCSPLQMNQDWADVLIINLYKTRKDVDALIRRYK